MKGNFITGLAAAALAIAVGLAVVALRSVGAAPTSMSSLPVAYNGAAGWSHGQARLPVIYIGESNVFVRAPHWSRWSGTSAYTRGELWVNTCSPTCSAGNYRTYPAQVSFWQVAVHKGARYFSRMRVRYSHGHQRDYVFRWSTLAGATIPGWNGGPG